MEKGVRVEKRCELRAITWSGPASELQVPADNGTRTFEVHTGDTLVLGPDSVDVCTYDQFWDRYGCTSAEPDTATAVEEPAPAAGGGLLRMLESFATALGAAVIGIALVNGVFWLIDRI